LYIYKNIMWIYYCCNIDESECIYVLVGQSNPHCKLIVNENVSDVDVYKQRPNI